MYTATSLAVQPCGHTKQAVDSIALAFARCDGPSATPKRSTIIDATPLTRGRGHTRLMRRAHKVTPGQSFDLVWSTSFTVGVLGYLIRLRGTTVIPGCRWYVPVTYISQWLLYRRSSVVAPRLGIGVTRSHHPSHTPLIHTAYGTWVHDGHVPHTKTMFGVALHDAQVGAPARPCEHRWREL